jgi:hypothetical protein
MGHLVRKIRGLGTKHQISASGRLDDRTQDPPVLLQGNVGKGGLDAVQQYFTTIYLYYTRTPLNNNNTRIGTSHLALVFCFV